MENQTIVQMLVSGQSDLEWFNSNLSSLISKFNDQFIAFKNRTVMDYDSDLNRLMLKLKEKEIDTSNIFIRFVSKVKSIL